MNPTISINIYTLWPSGIYCRYLRLVLHSKINKCNHHVSKLKKENNMIILMNAEKAFQKIHCSWKKKRTQEVRNRGIDKTQLLNQRLASYLMKDWIFLLCNVFLTGDTSEIVELGTAFRRTSFLLRKYS